MNVRDTKDTAEGTDPRLDWRAGEPAPPPVLRHRRDGILPAVAAALSVRDEVLTCTGSKAEQQPGLHPLVQDLLDTLPVAQRERFAGRCPEPVLLSRFLASFDAGRSKRASRKPLTSGEARKALKGAKLTARRIREDGDPAHGSYAPPCRTCLPLLSHFGVRPFDPSEVSTRFAVGVDAALRAAGWQPGRWDIRQAEIWADTLRAYSSPGGHEHAVFPAAVEAWAEFGGLTVPPAGGPGRHVAPTTVRIDPLAGLHLARTLGDLGRALDTEVCPLGEEASGHGQLAIDATGRVYALDHTGDWYLGPTIDTALSALALGLRPRRLTP